MKEEKKKIIKTIFHVYCCCNRVLRMRHVHGAILNYDQKYFIRRSLPNLNDTLRRFHFINFNFFRAHTHRDMLPLPYATKENYKVILYRLADCDPEKVSVSASAFCFVCFVV